MVVIAKVFVAAPGPVAVSARFAGVFLEKLDELLRMPDGQHAEHYGLDQAEDRGVGADAERQ